MVVLLVAGIGVALVLLAILVLRLHPFLGLLLATLFVLAFTPKSSWLRLQLTDQLLSVQKLTDHGDISLSSAVVENIDYLTWRAGTDQPSAVVWHFEYVDSSDATMRWVRPTAVGASPDPNHQQATAFDIGDWFVARDDYEAALMMWQQARLVTVLPRLAEGISQTLQRIGLPIIMAAIIGVCLLHSGAAQSLVLAITKFLGEQRLAPSLMISGFVLGIPIYFDTVFYLLLPLAKVFASRHQAKSILVVMSIVVGATMAHSLVPPTPGPLLVASQLGVSLGTAFIGGLVVGGTASCAGYVYSLWCNRSMSISILGLTEDPNQPLPPAEGELTERGQPKIHILLAMLPLLIPIVCLGGAEIYESSGSSNDPQGRAMNNHTSFATHGLLSLLGDPSFVLLISAAISYLLLRRAISAKESTPLIAKALSDAGVILLLTCAGGAFGAALGQLGVAGALAELAPNLTATYSLLPAAFLLTALIRVAQGSATVAMITSVGIVSPLVAGQTLPFHPVYVALAIGSGSKLMPWMNDSGFWQVATMTGMTVQQTLKTFSAALTLMGCVGFLVTLLGAWFFPMI